MIASIFLGTRPRLGQVMGHAMVGTMRWLCWEDTGLPRAWLVKHVVDAVRETLGISVSLEKSSSLLPGRVPRILWDRFRGFWAKEELHDVGIVHKLCRVTIYSKSRVHGHGTQFILGHTRSTRNC